MLDMTPSGNPIFLQIQNSKKPEQVISLVLNESNEHFETEGLKHHFGLEEIWIDKDEFLQSMDQFASVLSFLLETMSAAQDLNLPYGLQERFQFAGRTYYITKQNSYSVLTLLE